MKFKWKGKTLLVEVSPEDVSNSSFCAAQCWISAGAMDGIRSKAPKSLGPGDEPDVYVTVTDDGETETFKVDVPIVFAGGDCLFLLSRMPVRH